VKVGRVAVDGTKVKANASKHKAMSYGRMKEKEKDLKAEVKQLTQTAQNRLVSATRPAWDVVLRGQHVVVRE
jgi:hypothetical protein